MLLRSLLSCFGFVLLSTNVSAQFTVNVTGRVIDAVSRETIKGASVRVVGHAAAITTGEDGRFIIRGVKSGRQMLVIEHAAYAKRAQSIGVPNTATLTLEIGLDPRRGKIDRGSVTVITTEDPRTAATVGRGVIIRGRMDNTEIRPKGAAARRGGRSH